VLPPMPAIGNNGYGPASGKLADRSTWAFLPLLRVQEPEQEHSVDVAVPVRQGPHDKPSRQNHPEKTLGPNHGEEKHLVRGKCVEVKAAIERSQNISVTHGCEDACGQQHPAHPRPAMLLFSQPLNKFGLLRCELHNRLHGLMKADSRVSIKDYP